MQPLVGTKATFDLVCKGYGWSHTLFLQTYSSGFVNELPIAQQLATKINLATNHVTSVSYIRLQNLAQLRQGQVFLPVSTYSPLGDGVQPQSALYLRLYNAARTQTKLLFFRGLVQNYVIDGGSINPSSAQVTLINSLWAQMVTDGWCWLGKAIGNTLPGPPFNQLVPQPVTAVTPVAGGFVALSFAGPIFNIFNANNSVKLPISLSGLKGADRLNGTWVCYAQSDRTCQLVKQVLFNPWVGPSGSGHSSWLQLVPINFGLQERTGQRKVGRPSFLSRGRSSRRTVQY
jgi:hypothetical protein